MLVGATLFTGTDLAGEVGLPDPLQIRRPSGPLTTVSAAQLASAEAALATLEVKGRAPMTGYSRDEFGPAWADVDGNGCDTRNDILQRDLTDLELDPDGCRVLRGVLLDPYSSATIEFERGERSAEVQIDHVVALADAWQKGAQQWTPERRRLLANDPANLLAVDGPLNQQKGAGDAATWLPPSRGFRCRFVMIQIEVKAAYGLWVTAAEQVTMGRELGRCVVADR